MADNKELKKILFILLNLPIFWNSPVAHACQDPIIISCDNTDQVFVTENSTRIVTSNTSDKCRFVIPREPGVCQMQLDFAVFELGEADSTGDCVGDLMTIVGSKTVNSLTVCGNLTGQHMYLDFGDSDKIDVTIQGKTTTVVYEIVTTQLKCNNPNRAPAHCLQYFKAEKGIVKSFNFPRQQLNNQKYSVCVEPLSGTQAIQWKACKDSSAEPFFISGNIGKGKSNLLGAAGAVTGNQCLADFVQIFGENRMCGSSFAQMTSSAKPFMLHVNFDASELPLFPFPPVISMPVYNRLDSNINGNFGPPGTGSGTGPCPDMSAVGLVCTPPPIPCDANELGNRRGKETTICTCTAAGHNSDAMNTGFCLEFLQI